MIFGAINLTASLLPDSRSLRLRFGTAILAVVAGVYFFTSALGLIPDFGLIEAWVWDGLISPYFLISVSHNVLLDDWRGGVEKSPSRHSDEGLHLFFSTTMLCISIAGVAGAVLIVKQRTAGQRIWIGFIALLSLSLAAYAYAILLYPQGWGIAPQVFWEALVLVGFLLVRRG
ncbi:MAG: hypothetical protein M3N93_04470 [Acidobacteriota bacterium]|nr:hypothetical protein [Acidobacteriota bacterium]